MPNELEAIRKIRDGKSLEGIDGELQLDLFVDDVDSTVVHTLVEHNMLNELKRLLSQKSASEVLGILGAKTPSMSSPLADLMSYILLDDDYPEPQEYSEMICFLLQSGVNIDGAIEYLLHRKATHSRNEDIVNTVDKLLEIMEACDPENVPKSIAAAMHIYEEILQMADAKYALMLQDMDAQYGTLDSLLGSNSTDVSLTGVAEEHPHLSSGALCGVGSSS